MSATIDLSSGRGDEAIAFTAPAMTLGELRRAAGGIADLLGPSGPPVFLYCDRAANFVPALLACLSLRREVILPGHAAPKYLDEIGARSGVLLTDADAAGFDAILLPASSGRSPLDLRIPLDAPLTFLTSGSTGQPKACRKHFGQIVLEVEIGLSVWPAAAGPIVSTVSHQHIYGLLFTVVMPLLAGRATNASRAHGWDDIVRHLGAGQATLVTTPAHLSRIPDHMRPAAGPAAIFSSGAPLAHEAAGRALETFGVLPTEVLGSTETGGIAWRRQASAAEPWTPLPRVSVEMDGEGMLTVVSPLCGTDEPLRTGDLAAINEDGRFHLRGRGDRIAKIEGKRVSLARVEQAIVELAEVSEAAAADLPDRGGALGAVVVLTENGAARREALGRFRFGQELRVRLSDRLEPMERPRFWRVVDEIPVSPQGKRVQADLRGLFAEAATFPIIRHEVTGPDAAVYDLELQDDLCWFEGHFPALPILPGVAQIHIASLLAKRAWDVDVSGRDLSRVKFRRPTYPGDILTLQLRRAGGTRVDFEYQRGDEVTASGTMRGA